MKVAGIQASHQQLFINNHKSMPILVVRQLNDYGKLSRDDQGWPDFFTQGPNLNLNNYCGPQFLNLLMY